MHSCSIKTNLVDKVLPVSLNLCYHLQTSVLCYKQACYLIEQKSLDELFCLISLRHPDNKNIQQSNLPLVGINLNEIYSLDKTLL